MDDAIAIDGGGGGVYPDPLAGATWPRPPPAAWREGARAPRRLADRARLRFADARNREWLRSALARGIPGLTPDQRKFALIAFDSAFEDFTADGAGDALDVVGAGAAIPRAGTNDIAELRRLNHEFLAQRIRSARAAALYGKQAAARNRWTEDDTEDYAWRQFEADSLRPAGFESLNGREPLYELLEDTRRVNAAGYRRREGFTSRAEPDPPAHLWGDDGGDEAWDERGDAGRSVERARAEFERSLGFAPNRADRDVGAAPPTRYARYEEIPRWQKLSREGADRDIEETLGSGMRENLGQHRGWGLDELFRRGSARTGSARPRAYGPTHSFIA